MPNFQLPSGASILEVDLLLHEKATIDVNGFGSDNLAPTLLSTNENIVAITDGKTHGNGLHRFTITGKGMGNAHIQAQVSSGTDVGKNLIIPLKVSILGPSDTRVRPITEEVFPNRRVVMTDNLVPYPPRLTPVIVQATFLPGIRKNNFDFMTMSSSGSRVGVFAARKGGLERAAILVLPQTGVPDRVLIGISHGFGQNYGYYSQLGWNNPLSVRLIQDVISNHILSGNNWGGQVLSARKKVAFLHIVRASGIELGPFAHDGEFLRKVLTEIVKHTNGAFSFTGGIEAFTYSSGMGDLNGFLKAVSGHLPVKSVYTIDPAPLQNPFHPPGAVIKQYWSGSTGDKGHAAAGFEFLPLDRWKKERPNWAKDFAGDSFQYLHNFCMPRYVLHLALQTL